MERMKRSLIAFVTIAALVALASCSRTTPAPHDEPGTNGEPPPEPPPVVAAPTLTGGAWVAEEPWIDYVEGAAVEVGTVHYKLTFTTSRFIHNDFSIGSDCARCTVESNSSGTRPSPRSLRRSRSRQMSGRRSMSSATASRMTETRSS